MSMLYIVHPICQTSAQETLLLIGLEEGWVVRTTSHDNDILEAVPSTKAIIVRSLYKQQYLISFSIAMYVSIPAATRRRGSVKSNDANHLVRRDMILFNPAILHTPDFV
jgi:hypothetical protein